MLARGPAAAQRQLAANAIRCTSILSEVDRASLSAHRGSASIVAGDAHALDDGRRLTVLVLRVVALALGVPYGETPAQRRGLWRAANVLCDEVSTTALCAGLTPVDDGTAASLLRARSAERWATHLTMRDLDQLRWAQPPMVVSVCENPRVPGARDRHWEQRAHRLHAGQPDVRDPPTSSRARRHGGPPALPRRLRLARHRDREPGHRRGSRRRRGASALMTTGMRSSLRAPSPSSCLSSVTALRLRAGTTSLAQP